MLGQQGRVALPKREFGVLRLLLIQMFPNAMAKLTVAASASSDVSPSAMACRFHVPIQHRFQSAFVSYPRWLSFPEILLGCGLRFCKSALSPLAYFGLALSAIPLFVARSGLGAIAAKSDSALPVAEVRFTVNSQKFSNRSCSHLVWNRPWDLCSAITQSTTI